MNKMVIYYECNACGCTSLQDAIFKKLPDGWEEFNIDFYGNDENGDCRKHVDLCPFCVSKYRNWLKGFFQYHMGLAYPGEEESLKSGNCDRLRPATDEYKSLMREHEIFMDNYKKNVEALGRLATDGGDICVGQERKTEEER